MEHLTDAEIVEQIHNEFFTAGDKALDEAKDILANPKLDLAEQAARFIALGFHRAKPVTEITERKKKSTECNNLIEAITYFRVNYPNHKFIMEEDVKKICYKYGLLFGESENYTGDIPVKNLEAIEAFTLRKEDYTEKNKSSWEMMMDMYAGISLFSPRRSGRNALNSDLMAGFDGIIPTMNRQAQGYAMGIDPVYNKKADKSIETEKAPFKICAPKSDFNTMGYEIRDGYRLVYDPVVLQPVRHAETGVTGYLIVTAWGAESADATVINHNQN